MTAHHCTGLQTTTWHNPKNHTQTGREATCSICKKRIVLVGTGRASGVYWCTKLTVTEWP